MNQLISLDCFVFPFDLDFAFAFGTALKYRLVILENEKEQLKNHLQSIFPR